MKNYYEILEVNKDIDMGALKKRYRELAKKYHPDKFVNESEVNQKKAKDRFTEINEAYETLSNEELRKEYDRKLLGEKQNTKQTKREYSKDINRGDFFNKQDVNSMFSNFFTPKSSSEKTDGELKDKTNKMFDNFFGFKGRKK